MRAAEVRAAVAALVLLAGCSAGRIEQGVFHSAKGYAVTLPAAGWRLQPDGAADLTLARGAPPGGMLADATCEGRPVTRPLPVLSRHLQFGLVHRAVVEDGPVEIDGRPGRRSVVRGQRDGTDVGVEAVVLADRRCVYDFLYVAPAASFAEGQAAFRAFVESFRAGER